MNEEVEGRGQSASGRLVLPARISPPDFNGFQIRRTQVTSSLSFTWTEQEGEAASVNSPFTVGSGKAIKRPFYK